MEKHGKLIVKVLLLIILILIIIIFFLLKKINNNCNNEIEINANNSIKEMAGIYHNNNWNGNEASLYLYEDMTCKYPNTSQICEWNIEDNHKIIIKLSRYVLKTDNSYLSFTWFYTKESCQEEEDKNYKNGLGHAECVLENGGEYSAVYTSSGIDLHEHLFYKVGD